MAMSFLKTVSLRTWLAYLAACDPREGPTYQLRLRDQNGRLAD